MNFESTQEPPESSLELETIEVEIGDRESLKREIAELNALVQKGEVMSRFGPTFGFDKAKTYQFVEEEVARLENQIRGGEGIVTIDDLKEEIEIINSVISRSEVMTEYGHLFGFDKDATYKFLEDKVLSLEDQIHTLEQAQKEVNVGDGIETDDEESVGPSADSSTTRSTPGVNGSDVPRFFDNPLSETVGEDSSSTEEEGENDPNIINIETAKVGNKLRRKIYRGFRAAALVGMGILGVGDISVPHGRDAQVAGVVTEHAPETSVDEPIIYAPGSVEADSVSVDSILEKLAQGRKLEYVAKLEYIKRNLSNREGIPKDLLTADFLEKKSEDKSFQVEGFENAGISNEALNRFILATYPQNLTHKNMGKLVYVDSVQYSSTDSLYTLGLSYRGKDKVAIFSHAFSGRDKDKSSQYVVALDSTIAHEFGHQVDWLRSADLTLDQRIDFLYEALQEYDNPNGWKDSYPHKKETRENPEKKDKLVIEWWASLVSAYMHGPELLRECSPSSYELAEKWVKRMDHDYVAEEQVKKRDEAVTIITALKTGLESTPVSSATNR